MSSTTEISNMAISHLGISQEIANLDSDPGAEAQACRRFFDPAIETFQRDFHMSFATKRKVLGVITNDPNDEYSFEYEYPSDCIMVERIISGLNTDNRQSQVPYVIVRGTSGKTILSNYDEAELEYSVIESDTGRLPADVVMAFSYKLAELVAPRITSGDPFGLGLRAKQNYEEAKTIAWANNMNEMQEEEEPESEFIREMNVDQNPINRGVPWTPFPDGSDIV